LLVNSYANFSFLFELFVFVCPCFAVDYVYGAVKFTQVIIIMFWCLFQIQTAMPTYICQSLIHILVAIIICPFYHTCFQTIFYCCFFLFHSCN